MSGPETIITIAMLAFALGLVVDYFISRPAKMPTLNDVYATHNVSPILRFDPPPHVCDCGDCDLLDYRGTDCCDGDKPPCQVSVVRDQWDDTYAVCSPGFGCYTEDDDAYRWYVSQDEEWADLMRAILEDEREQEDHR